jgi:hypothetical protein
MKQPSNRHSISRGRVKTLLRGLTLVSLAAAAGALLYGNGASAQTLHQRSEAETIEVGLTDPVCCAPEDRGAVVEAWAFGSLTEATQPSSALACDPTHPCDLIVADPGGSKGHGFMIKTFFNPQEVQFNPNLSFILNETINYPGATSNGSEGECFPSDGTISISVNPSSTLVLDFQGQACQLGSRNGLVFDGHYVADNASTGAATQQLDAIGAIQMETPSGLSGGWTGLKVALEGQLLFTKAPK